MSRGATTGFASVAWLLIGCTALVLLAANAHLVYIATQSQPDCVAHHRPGEDATTPNSYGAAQSSCTPGAPRAVTHANAE